MKVATAFCVLAITLFISGNVYAADTYLKIGDIKGEAAVEGRAEGRAGAGGAGASMSAEGSAQVSSERENQCEAGCRDTYGGSGSAAFDACIRNCGTVGPAESARISDKASPQLMKINAEGKVGESKGETVQHNESDLEFLTRGVSLQAVEVRGWDPEKKREFLASVKSHRDVKSEQELENFAQGVLLNDENIESLSFNYQKIEFEYKSQGRLFGFIPISYRQSVTVDVEAEGEERVKVKFPWYHFLLAKGVTEGELDADISAAIGSELAGPRKNGSIVAADYNAEVRAYAQTFTTISNILKTKHDAAMASIQNIR